MKYAAWLGVAVLCGCETVEGLYERNALEGLPANVSGTWLAKSGPFLLTLRQENVTADGTWRDLRITADQPSHHPVYGAGTREVETDVTGEVRGRVLRGRSKPQKDRSGVEVGGIQAHMFLFAFTISPDGKTGECGLNLMIDPAMGSLGTWKSGMIRYSIRPSESPLPPGGTVCTLPVTSDGGVPGLTERATDARDVWVSLHYTRDLNGEIMPSRILLPVEAPRKASWIHYPGPGMYAGILDRGSLQKARAGSAAVRKGQVSFETRNCWWVLAPGWDEGAADLTPTKYVAELYREDPDGQAMPFETADVARRAPDGSWQSFRGYLLTARVLTCVRAVIEDGKPARVELIEPEDPALEEILAGPDRTITLLRWKNRALVAVKNRTLPGLLRDAKTKTLSSLAERLEQAVLDANHEVERGKDRAQRSVEQGKEASADREWVLAYQERVEVLKPILTAIKEEIANRGK